jgi:3-hydroxyisobutyrate dehydrogenase
MTTIAFIGLGNMGAPMAGNLVKAGHVVRGFDLAEANLAGAEDRGVTRCGSIGEACQGAEVVITMLPAGPAVRTVYEGDDGALARAGEGTLLIDCSTIDVATARAVAEAAAAKGFTMVDAPVSGGVGGAEAGQLAFMVGGDDATTERVRPILEPMAKAIIAAGGPGNGQAAKICNNMVLGVSMIAVGEAFALADRLGLDRQRLFDIASQSSGQCWSLTTYCPVPGPVPTSPANNDYKPGFSAAMMLKDLKLAQEAAHNNGAAVPLGAEAEALYQLFCNAGNEGVDFSGIFRMISQSGEGAS